MLINTHKHKNLFNYTLHLPYLLANFEALDLDEERYDYGRNLIHVITGRKMTKTEQYQLSNSKKFDVLHKYNNYRIAY